MDAELVAAATGALVQAMTTDAWSTVRGQVARLFGRGGREEEVAAELETVREEVTADGDEVAAVAWLRRALRADPGFAAELRSLLDELEPSRTSGGTTNVISGGTFHGKVIQADRIDTVN
ncbi:hypothetical protein [Kitasatospora sp. NPDC002040]|uniref:hypothetical protein n=1 Tax=Kitasatospora sp. NPDC002040 TaxID=3154661 RepID=UPI00332C73A6